MMSISMIAPAFAASPWNNIFECDVTGFPFVLEGSEDGLIAEGRCNTTPDVSLCVHISGADGVLKFMDRNGNGILDVGEKVRCAKL